MHEFYGARYRQDASVVDEIGEHNWPMSVVFKDNSAGRWRDVAGYGGFWTENIVQAIARDLLAYAMLRLEKHKYPIVLHVHDEAVAEVPEKNLTKAHIKQFERLMCELPDWAEGLPVVAEAWTGHRFI